MNVRFYRGGGNKRMILKKTQNYVNDETKLPKVPLWKEKLYQRKKQMNNKQI